MKIFSLAALALVLTACTTVEQQSAPASSSRTAVTDKGVQAFRDICLATAPGYAKAPEKAAKYGLKLDNNIGGIGFLDMTADKSLSAQVQPGRECSVTTEKRLTSTDGQFREVVGQVTNVRADDLVRAYPFPARMSGQNFMFHHDRNGGEAYVMMNTGR